MSQFLQDHFNRVGPPADAGLTRGVLGRRFCAFVTDIFIIGVLSWILALTIFIFGILTLGLGFLLYHIIPVLPFIYYTWCVGASRGTAGQRLFGVSVRQDVNLAPPNLAQALVWTLLMWLSFLMACVPFAVALVGPRHRAAHDLLSGLVVVRN